MGDRERSTTTAVSSAVVEANHGLIDLVARPGIDCSWARHKAGRMIRKHQVFISSAMEDLREARSELILETLCQGQIPFGMEMFNPGTTKSLDVIREKVQQSDIFVILVGARLGARTTPEPRRSFTEFEFELALQLGLPILAFLLDESEFRRIRSEVPVSDLQREDDSALMAFRERVTRINGGSRIVGWFSHNDLGTLRSQYGRALNDCVTQLTHDKYSGGWVPGSEYAKFVGRHFLEESVSSNPFFLLLTERLEKFETLSRRTTVAQAQKRVAAKFFWTRYLEKLYRTGINSLFFESGSSVAYVSREFIAQAADQDWFTTRGMPERLRIRTNNLLTYVDFLLRDVLRQPMDVGVFPHGAFSKSYGASCGSLSGVVRAASPNPGDSLRRNLPVDAQERVDEMTRSLRQEMMAPCLILMTASGVDISSDSGHGYPGPHVGSYANMLFKRSLFDLECPKVLFLHREKWGFRFIYSNCHAVCDQSFPWERVRSEKPMAIAMAVDSEEEQKALAESLTSQGFVHVEPEIPAAGHGDGPRALIAANEPFARFFRS